MTHQAQVLLPGAATAPILRLDAPISFWGGVSPETGHIQMAGHPQNGMSISGKALVIPRLIGSSSSSAILLELIYATRAPGALILGAADAILPVGVIIARQMAWQTLPVLVLPDPPFDTDQIATISETGEITTGD